MSGLVVRDQAGFCIHELDWKSLTQLVHGPLILAEGMRELGTLARVEKEDPMIITLVSSCDPGLVLEIKAMIPSYPEKRCLSDLKIIMRYNAKLQIKIPRHN